MSDCGVCIYSDCNSYCDPSGFQDVRIHKARKEHRCCECGEVIRIGQRYERYAGKHEGEFCSIDTCLPCAEIADAFYCDGRLYGGGLWESMSYVMSELTTSCFDKLTTPEAKEFLRQRWIKWKFTGTELEG